MIELFILFFLWLAFIELAPLLIEALFHLLRFLTLAIGVALRELMRGIAFLLRHACRLAARAAVLIGRGIATGFTFLCYFAQEALRGESPDPEPDEEAAEEELYRAALLLLGLAEDYTRSALDAAFRQAMKTAHPDLGGSVDQAQAVNAARDVLMQRAGWA